MSSFSGEPANILTTRLKSSTSSRSVRFILLFVNFFQWKVRRTLAFSIHELAVILGDQLTAGDLVPVFNGFLKDLDEVRIGVLKHLHDFLKVCLCSFLAQWDHAFLLYFFVCSFNIAAV